MPAAGIAGRFAKNFLRRSCFYRLHLSEHAIELLDRRDVAIVDLENDVAARQAQPGRWACVTDILHDPPPLHVLKRGNYDDLGEQVTRWLRANADLEIVDRTVVQSSDNEFHCLTVVLFYKPRNGAKKV